jgi:hypothetical protein
VRMGVDGIGKLFCMIVGFVFSYLSDRVGLLGLS